MLFIILPVLFIVLTLQIIPVYSASIERNILITSGILLHSSNAYFEIGNDLYFQSISFHDNNVSFAMAGDNTVQVSSGFDVNCTILHWYQHDGLDYIEIEINSPINTDITFTFYMEKINELTVQNAKSYTSSWTGDTRILTIIANTNVNNQFRIDMGYWFLAYIDMWIGLIGLSLVVGSPTYLMYKAKNDDWEEGLTWGVVAFVLGSALIISWLWS